MKMTKYIKIALLSTLSFGFAGAATAVPITMTFEGTASGGLNGATFTNESFVFTTVADTDDIQAFSNGLFYDNDLATIDLQGNTYTINTSTSSNLNTEFNSVTFGNDDLQFDALILPNVLFGWDMLSSIGPINATGLIESAGSSWQTSGGNLFFNPNDSSALTFTASVVPVPAAVWLFGSGLLGLVGVARRKRAE